MKAMILAAGRGERMGELTNITPKPLTEVGNTTLLKHNIERVERAGIRDIVINIAWLGQKIKDYVLENFNHLNIEILDEGNQMLGTGGGIKNALVHLGSDPFFLVNADVFSDWDLSPKTSLEDGTLGHLYLVPNPPHHPGGDFNLSQSGFLETGDQCMFTFSGMSLIHPNLLANITDKVFPLEPILEVSASNRRLTGEIIEGSWIDVGSPERLQNAERLISYKSLGSVPSVS